MNENKDHIKQKVFSGLFWKFAERITAQIVSLIVSIMLARLLEPDIYGSVAIVMIFITIANVFVSNGFGNALVQKKNADNLDFSSVFYINIVMSIGVYFILYALAPLVAKFYEMPILCPTLRVLGIRIIIAAINSIQQAYVSRKMIFKKFFWATLFGTVLSGVVGIYLAYKGAGVWALVAQYLTNTCVDTIVLWITVKWRPDFAFSWKRAKGLISYGWKLLCSGLLDTGYSQLRNLLIGKIYTSADLAYYNQGDKYPQVLVVNINSSISSVLFPAMSKYQDDRQRVKAMTRSAIQVSSYVMWPLMLGLATIAEPLVKVLLTDKWLPCVPYLQIFCFSYGLWPIHTTNLQALNALGRTDLFLKLEIIKKCLGLTVLIITLQLGPHVIAFGLIITGIISTFINSAPNRKLLNYSYKEQLSDLLPPFVLALIMAIIIYPINTLEINDVLVIVLQIISGGIIYGAGSVFSKQKGFFFIKNFIKNQKDKKGQ